MFSYHLLILIFVQIIFRFQVSVALWLVPYALYQLSFLAFAGYITLKYNANFGSAMVLLCESVRFFMKNHSYLRNKLLYWYSSYLCSGSNQFQQWTIPGKESSKVYIPYMTVDSVSLEFKKFLYFSFAPTLLYRDTYSKKAKCDWRIFFAHLLNFVLCVHYTALLFNQIFNPIIKEANVKNRDTQ